MCVCDCLYERVCACLSGNLRCGTIWGVSKQAGESHAGCSLASVLMEFNLDLSSPHSSQCHYGFANFGFALQGVSVCFLEKERKY